METLDPSLDGLDRGSNSSLSSEEKREFNDLWGLRQEKEKELLLMAEKKKKASARRRLSMPAVAQRRDKISRSRGEVTIRRLNAI